MKTSRSSLLFAAALFAPCALLADYAKEFNVKFAGYAGTTALTNFPALIRLSQARNGFDYSKCRLADGGDVRFFDADDNLLPCEVDTWDPNGESLIWVSVPELTKDTVITVRYGSAEAPAVTATDVWTNGYVAVWHMGAEEGSRSQSDATMNGKTVTCPSEYATGVQSGVDGKVGLAARFGLRSDNFGGFSRSGSGFFDGFGEITVEAWTFRDEGAEKPSSNATIVDQSRYTGSWGQGWSMYEQANSEKIGFWFYRSNDQGTWMTAPSATPAQGEWHYHARAWSGTTGVTLRTLDATTDSSGSAPATPETLRSVENSTLCIGNRSANVNGTTPFRGVIDEVRISNVFRSKDWVSASYATVASDDFAVYEVPNDWGRYTYKFSVSFPGVPDSATLTDFPVLVKVSEAGIPGFLYADCTKEGGADLRFTDGNGMAPLPCEVETWDTNGVSTVWVKVPTLTKDTRITGYYGWNLAPAVSPTDVWDEHYRAVWHMNSAEGSRSQKDSTANGKTVTCPANYSDGVQSGVEGKVGLAARCGLRSDNYGGFGISDSGYFDGYGEITVEAWTFRDVGAETLSVVGTIIEKSRRSSNWKYAWSMYEQKNGEKIGFWFYSGVHTDGLWLTAPDPTPAQGEWHYHARRWSGTTGVDSRTLDVTTATSQSSVPATPDSLTTVSDGILCIGNCTTLGLSNNTLNTPFHGDIDEVRISDIARSDVWVKATHDTIADNATFTTYGNAHLNAKATVIFFR